MSVGDFAFVMRGDSSNEGVLRYVCGLLARISGNFYFSFRLPAFGKPLDQGKAWERALAQCLSAYRGFHSRAILGHFLLF